jgi:hypothetical protein
MVALENCPECRGTNLFAYDDIRAQGVYGPDLLPRTGGVLTPAKMKAVVCKDCGLVRFYASQETLAGINSGNGWQRLFC